MPSHRSISHLTKKVNISIRIKIKVTILFSDSNLDTPNVRKTIFSNLYLSKFVLLVLLLLNGRCHSSM